MTNIDTLKEIEQYCPTLCSYLHKKINAYEFLCTEYDALLRVDSVRRVCKCQECLNSPTLKKYCQFNMIIAKLLNDTPDLLNYDSFNLLSNIFKVLDASEQSQMIAILDKPATGNAFLKDFDAQPKDNDLVKDVRALLRANQYNTSLQQQYLKNSISR